MKARVSVFRQSRRLLLVSAAYGAITVATVFAAHLLRFDFSIPSKFFRGRWVQLIWLVPIRLLILYYFRQYRSLFAGFAAAELPRLVLATGVSSAVFVLLRVLGGISLGPPKGVIATEAVLFLGSVAGLRLLWRELPSLLGRQQGLRIGVVGAGSVGQRLVSSLHRDRKRQLRPVVFFDDNPAKQGRYYEGVPIWGSVDNLRSYLRTRSLDRIAVAMPSAPKKRIREVIAICRQEGLDVVQTPSMIDIMVGKVGIDHLRAVQPEDLLGRDPVSVDADQLREIFGGRPVLVTGAAGSIGSELCRQLVSLGARVIAVDRSEGGLFVLVEELGLGRIEPRILDVNDRIGLARLLERSGPDLCFHAAAYKHVPLMEAHPREAWRNNVEGTLAVLECCAAAGVRDFCLISTDKVVHPSSVMGATKRIAELLTIAFGDEGRMRTFAVRFGNVLDSSGSVLPTFKRQIQAGGPVTVTDPEVTRYFMTIPEAVGLVLNSASMVEGGEVFLLDMGEPVRIAELARQLIDLTTDPSGPPIEIIYTGLRPGEKLHEQLAYELEARSPTAHSKISRLSGVPLFALDRLRERIGEIGDAARSSSPEAFREVLLAFAQSEPEPAERA